MNADDLRKAERQYQESVRLAERDRELRNWLIYKALDAGWTHAQIADATGLTRARVGQIALGKP